MSLRARAWCRALGAAVLAWSVVLPSAAQSGESAFPSRQITIVTGFQPGGGTDIVARFIALRMQEVLNQTVIVDNRPGAGGAVGAKHVASSRPDGHTLYVGTPGTNAVIPLLNPSVGYDPAKDFAPITMLLRTPLLLSALSGTPHANFQAFMAAGREGKATANVGGAGAGSGSHLVTEMLNAATGAKYVYVPYKGSAPAAMALLGGEIAYTFLAGPDAMPHLRAGKIVPLMNAASGRDPAFPDVPIPSELGIKGIDLDTWFGLFAPAGTPKPVVDRLHQVVSAILREPATQAKWKELVASPHPLSPEAFTAVVLADIEAYRRAIKTAGIKLQ